MKFTVYQTFQDSEYCEVEIEDTGDLDEMRDLAQDEAYDRGAWRSCQNVEFISSRVEDGWS